MDDVLVGDSRAIRKVKASMALAARNDMPVHIRGASGTGKELVARSIHDLSRRTRGPFVAVNCAAVPDALFENEFFGHERGAYTGADASYQGVFSRADGGTLLMDEVAELKLEHQAKLLRVLQFQEFRPVGGPLRRTDVRVITATHRDLRAEVKAGRFREDLYYRVNVVPVRVPDLSERVDDIPAIALHLLKVHGDKVERPLEGFTRPALEALEARGWPGNVRQLSNVIMRAMMVAAGPLIDVHDLPRDSMLPGRLSLVPGPVATVNIERPFTEQKKSMVAQFERMYAEKMLEATGGNITEAARRAGLDRKSFWKLLRRLGLN